MDQDVWEVLADPTRREIVRRLAAGDLTAGQIAAGFDIARPGVSRHLRILREAHMVDVRADAQSRVYRLRQDALAPLASWHAQVAGFWEQRLDALATEVARGHRRSTDTGRKHDDRAAG